MKRKTIIIVAAMTAILTTVFSSFMASATTTVTVLNSLTSLTWSDSGGTKYPVNGDTLSVKLYDGGPNTQGNFGVFALDTETGSPSSFAKNIVYDMKLKITVGSGNYVAITFRDANSSGDPWAGSKYGVNFETYGDRQVMALRKNNSYIKSGDDTVAGTYVDLTSSETTNTILTDQAFHRVTISAVDDSDGNCLIKVYLDNTLLINYTDKRGVLGVGGIRFCCGADAQMDVQNETDSLPADAIPADAATTSVTAASESSSETTSSNSIDVASNDTTAANSTADSSTSSTVTTSTTVKTSTTLSQTSTSEDSDVGTIANEDGGISATTIIIIIAIIVILTGGGVALYFILKKK